MAERYIPLFLDFNETTQDLTDEECGRLIRAVVRYANGEDTEDLLQGAERIAFRFLKGNVDRNIQLSAIRARAGSKGGSISKPKQTEEKASKTTTKTKTEPKTKTETETDTKTHTQPFLPDTEAAGIQHGHDRVLEAAQNAGFKSSPAERAGLLSLCAEYGPDRTVSGIGECVRHAAPTLAYLEAVLKGTGKKTPQIPGSYQQRDYSSEQEAAMDRMMAMEW